MMLILNVIFIFFALISLVISYKIARSWDSSKSTTEQYTLEKQSYLGAVLIKYILVLKLPLFIFYIFTLDTLSAFIPGAMCAAGVITSSEYGVYLFVLKIIILYFFASWLLLHNIDTQYDDYRYTKRKFILFIPLAFVLFLEIALEVSSFNALDISKIVSCCGTLFNPVATSYVGTLLHINPLVLLSLFYGLFVAMFIYKKHCSVFASLNTVFIWVSILSLIVVFSPYVYELPTHKCPFCLLQHEYHYMGYFLYVTLFLGTFFAIGAWILTKTGQTPEQWIKRSLFFNSIYVGILSLYPLVYYFKNGVWL